MASQEIKQVIDNTINAYNDQLRDLSLEIHDHPEIGDTEKKAHHLLTNYLEKEGFIVTREAVGLKTAFIAEYDTGKPGRRIGFCSEYDALPGIGHACGHNLIAIGGVACALAIKTLLQDGLLCGGSVTLFGTPAEEPLTGKIPFVTTGELQRRVDVCMMVHPRPGNGVYVNMLACDWVTVEYFGRQSHAGAAPWDGINALDALMQGFDNVALMRQQTLPTNRIHGIIKEGGRSPNVIPAYASAYYYCRSTTRNQLKCLKAQVENCWEAAALATGCQLKITWSPHQCDDVFVNEIMADNYIKYMKAEGFEFNSRQIEEMTGSGSTDFGNMSYAVPGLHCGYYFGFKSMNHTAEFTRDSATLEAHKRTLVAARCLALTAADVSQDQDLYNRVVAYFEKGKAQ